MRVAEFWKSEQGAVSTDWVVLTAACVGTGLAVMSTVSSGIEALSSDLNSNMRGSLIRTTFSYDICEGGVLALQDREDARVAAAVARGEDPQAVDVQQLMLVSHSETDDDVLLEDYQDALAQIDPNAEWDRGNTMVGAMECALVQRGLL